LLFRSCPAQHASLAAATAAAALQGKTGYFQWREDLKASHAATVTRLMQEAGYDEASQAKVTRFILKKDLKKDPENQARIALSNVGPHWGGPNSKAKGSAPAHAPPAVH